ncbi:pyridoxal phosphate-dependent aminotransferase [Sporomusa sp.]|uniref:pyridoxal phosphate-dependent aminotransferase n=1 Tax=Sporomusa sp. TaxID=2078658 RepID=UPI002C11F13A|nr:aminotransferase class I/II-fold pyridoxal phosphate-dependent enzyme [Sporomusa sp.]HWR05464.1 aminotransferase class I/II-fold pyridoxal phosphate-dependent enzyme [Sporomusa sp.]
MMLTAPHTWGKYSPDKIFAVVAEANEARKIYGNDQVVNGAPGTFLDETETIFCLPTVEEIYRNLPMNEVVAYSPLEGTPDYLEAAISHVFREYRPEGHIKAVATPGGTGALHNIVANYSSSGETVLSSEWCWGPYKSITEDAQRKFETFSLFDGDRFNVGELEQKITKLLQGQDRLVVILNTPSHNPTGYSMTSSEWQAVLDISGRLATAGKSIILAIDVAYLDYTEDQKISRAFFPLLANLPANVLPIICFSMSKSFTMYGQRVGAMICVSRSAAVAEEFFETNQITSRASWSSVNRGASKILSVIYSNPELVKRSDKERLESLQIIKERAAIFSCEAKAVQLNMLPYRSGFFLTIPCSKPQAVCEVLKEKNIYLVPLAKGIRVSVCAIPTMKMRGIAARIKAAIDFVRE